jgi:hypothetical protein
MAYYLKQRKRKSKTSKRKNKKTKRHNKRHNKRTRRVRKQYGGKLNDQQMAYIEEQIKDLGFSDEQKTQVIKYFNEISQHASKQTYPGTNETVLETFFDNVNSTYRRNQTPEQKRDVFLGLLSGMYYNVIDKDPETDVEDEDV